jgi:hypothetical protein
MYHRLDKTDIFCIFCDTWLWFSISDCRLIAGDQSPILNG